MADQESTARVPLGELNATPNALEQLDPMELFQGLRRHVRRDWGDVCEEDWKANDQALIHGRRLLSAYKTGSGVKFWIITEADRSVTTVLMPSDY